MGEGCAAVELAAQQSQLTRRVVSKRVEDASARHGSVSHPVAGGREQLRASHVADAADAANVVAMETHDAVAPERNSADDLTLQGEAVAVARRDVEDRPDALLSSESDSVQR